MAADPGSSPLAMPSLMTCGHYSGELQQYDYCPLTSSDWLFDRIVESLWESDWPLP